jgi:integrase
VWYFRFVDADGVKVERRGCTDKRATEELARAAEQEASKIRAGLVDPRDAAIREHGARPLGEHLDAWHRDMLARGKTTKHAAQYRDRAGRLAAIVRGRAPADVEPGRHPVATARAESTLADALATGRLTDLQPERIQAALARLKDAGKAAQTVNHYRAAIRAFGRWALATGRLRDDPMRGVAGLNVAEDIRHARRTLTNAELARLIDAAATGPELHGMAGALRAMAYRAAIATGFRVAELRSLTPESFRLDGADPVVILKAGAAKSRKPATQPLPVALARDLRTWLGGQPAGSRVFPLHHETARAIRADLARAGIRYETDEGVADFHSLRACYISALVRSGATIKEVQSLARHAKPETTLKHYAKVSAHDLRRAVESLPAPTPDPEATPHRLAATGTDVQTYRPSPCPPFAHRTVRNGAGCGGQRQT